MAVPLIPGPASCANPKPTPSPRLNGGTGSPFSSLFLLFGGEPCGEICGEISPSEAGFEWRILMPIAAALAWAMLAAMRACSTAGLAVAAVPANRWRWARPQLNED